MERDGELGPVNSNSLDQITRIGRNLLLGILRVNRALETVYLSLEPTAAMSLLFTPGSK